MAVGFSSFPADSHAAVAKNPKWVKTSLKRKFDNEKQVIVFTITHKNISDDKLITAIMDKSFHYGLTTNKGYIKNFKFNKQVSSKVNNVKIYPNQSYSLTYTIKIGDKLWKDISTHRKNHEFDKRAKLKIYEGYKYSVVYKNL